MQIELVVLKPGSVGSLQSEVELLETRQDAATPRDDLCNETSGHRKLSIKALKDRSKSFCLIRNL